MGVWLWNGGCGDNGRNGVGCVEGEGRRQKGRQGGNRMKRRRDKEDRKGMKRRGGKEDRMRKGQR